MVAPLTGSPVKGRLSGAEIVRLALLERDPARRNDHRSHDRGGRRSGTSAVPGSETGGTERVTCGVGGGGGSFWLFDPSVCLSVCGFCSTAQVIESPSAVNLSHLCLFFFLMYFRLSFSESTLDKHLSGDENSLYFAFQSVCSSPQSSFLYSRLFVMASEHVIWGAKHRGQPSARWIGANNMPLWRNSEFSGSVSSRSANFSENRVVSQS